MFNQRQRHSLEAMRYIGNAKLYTFEISLIYYILTPYREGNFTLWQREPMGLTMEKYLYRFVRYLDGNRNCWNVIQNYSIYCSIRPISRLALVEVLQDGQAITPHRTGNCIFTMEQICTSYNIQWDRNSRLSTRGETVM